MRWGFPSPTICILPITAMLHSYFVRVIHLVGPGRLLTICICVPVVAESAIGIFVVKDVLRRSSSKFSLVEESGAVRHRWDFTLYAALVLCCNFLTTGCLWIVLIRKKVGAKKMDGPLKSLAFGAASTGIVTSLVSFLSLGFMFGSYPASVTFLGCVMGPAFAVVFMANVNVRSRLRMDSEPTESHPRQQMSMSVIVSREVAQEYHTEGSPERNLWTRMAEFAGEYPQVESQVYQDNPAFEA